MFEISKGSNELKVFVYLPGYIMLSASVASHSCTFCSLTGKNKSAEMHCSKTTIPNIFEDIGNIIYKLSGTETKL